MTTYQYVVTVESTRNNPPSVVLETLGWQIQHELEHKFGPAVRTHWDTTQVQDAGQSS